MALRIGLVGVGYINGVHATAALSVGATLAAVVNHRPETRAAFAQKYGVARAYDTIEALLTDGGVDALVVATPNALHAQQTIAALAAGVPVLVEKPMAVSPVECEAMLAASARSGAPLMVAHCWRFDDEVRWLRDHASAVGAVVRTKGYSVHVGSGPAGWFTDPTLSGGGALVDMGIHAIDTTRFVLGDPSPVSVYARLGTHYSATAVDDTGVLLINWEGGAVSYIESGWWQPHCDGVAAATQLYGVRGLASLFPTRVRTHNSDGSNLVVDDPGFAFPRTEHVPQAIYDRQMAHFLDCVRSGATPVPGGREGLINVKIVDAAYASARTGQVVEVK